MNNQEMLTAWADLQGRVERLTAIQLESQDILNRAELKKIQNRTYRSPIGDLVMAGIMALLLGGFIAGNMNDLLASPLAALPAIALMAFAIFIINMGVRQLILSADLDYAKPIVETQIQFAKLRKLRLQATQGSLFCLLPLWFLFPIWLGQWVIGVKFIFALNGAWIIANIATGLVIAYGVYRLLGKSRYALSLQNSLVGKDIQEAEKFVAEMKAFREG